MVVGRVQQGSDGLWGQEKPVRDTVGTQMHRIVVSLCLFVIQKGESLQWISMSNTGGQSQR